MSLYAFDAREGIITNKKLGLRGFIMGARQWNSLVEKMYERFGSAAETILFDAGKSYGSSELEGERERGDSSAEATLDLLSRTARAAGWGQVTISRDFPGEINVKVRKCVFCAEARKSNQKQVGCYFLGGVISGYASSLFSQQNHVDEILCGNDYCEFRVRLYPHNPSS